MNKISYALAATLLATVANTHAQEAPDPYMDIIYDAPEGVTTILDRSCDGFTIEAFSEASHSRILGSIVTMVETSDGEVYLSNIASEYPCSSFVKATREGDIITIKGPQPIAEDWDDNDYDFIVYVVPMQVEIDPETNQGYFNPTKDMTYQFKVEEDGTLVAMNPELLLGICTYGSNYDETDTSYHWAGYGDRDIKLAKVTSTTVTPPADAKILTWIWKDEHELSAVKACIDGNDIYLSGMNRDLPEAWVKGVIDGDKATFPSGQYLGPDYDIYYLSYFCGANFVTEIDEETGEEYRAASLAPAAEFRYDAEAETLTSINGYVINSTPDILYPLYGYENVTVGNQHRDANALPATPYDVIYNQGSWGDTVWCQVPNTDVDGKLLDESNLYYQIIIDGEPLVFTSDDYYEDYSIIVESTLIPYNTNGYDIYSQGTDKTVYLYVEPEKSIGVRSVYLNENGEYIYSAIGYDAVLSVGENLADKEVKSVEWYDLSGRRINRPTTGIAIKVTNYTDGTVKRAKSIVK